MSDRNAAASTLIVSLASLFYLFRELEKSYDFLALAHYIDPENQAVKEFMAVLLFELGEYEKSLSEILSLERQVDKLPKEILTVKGLLLEVTA